MLTRRSNSSPDLLLPFLGKENGSLIWTSRSVPMTSAYSSMVQTSSQSGIPSSRYCRDLYERSGSFVQDGIPNSSTGMNNRKFFILREIYIKQLPIFALRQITTSQKINKNDLWLKAGTQFVPECFRKGRAGGLFDEQPPDELQQPRVAGPDLSLQRPNQRSEARLRCMKQPANRPEPIV